MISILALLSLLPLGAQIRFEERTLATDLKSGYQVIAVDVNHDGRLDLVALASGMKDLYWFENPGWQRRVLAAGFNRMINAAPLDADGDGIPEFLLAHEFANVAKNSIGIVSLLEHGANLNEPWKAREIDRIPTSHRLRAIRLPGGAGIINAPLTDATAAPPDYRGHVPIVLYRPPLWKREPVDSSIQGVMHGIFVFDWDRQAGEELLTASFQGLHLLHPAKKGAAPKRLNNGDPAAWPKSGSSEVVVGRLGKRRFLASVDPWHGNQISVFTQHGAEWRRQVIDSFEAEAHTLHAADLDNDGRDEIIAGFRGAGRSVFYYRATAQGKWERFEVDRGGIAASGCAAADFDGDKRIDIACIGSATANLKLYRNRGAQ
ncbi:MAG: VCBS repeat-containing protein [Candidatus Solibacter usitatus]|nr:VCBS repeat-containing protein [Candidatus Solibacter usitatus]